MFSEQKSSPHILQPVFHGACFEAVSAPTLSAPGKALPGEDKAARTKSAPNPLQNTLHGKRAYHEIADL